MRALFALPFVLLATSALCAQDDSDVLVLYGGGDTLEGWVGREDLWSAEDGQIVGRTSAENPLQTNTFLIWKGELPSDFELTAQFKIEGGNSGIQYRSRVLDEEKFIVGGYQADFDSTNTFAGILYEERGRGIVAPRGTTATISADGEKSTVRFADAKALANGIHPGKWNDFRVVAKGNHLQHFINEAMTAEAIDEQTEKASTNGVIALQLHVGEPMVVRFKNIVVRRL